MIKRELYLKKLRNSYDSELIKVIMGKLEDVGNRCY